MKPKLFVSASIGWAVRNYFQTGLVKSLTTHFDVIVVTTPAIRAEIERQGLGEGLQWIVLDSGTEPFTWRMARQIKKKIYVEGRRSNTEQLWERYTKRPFYQRAGGKVIRALTRVIRAPRLFAFAERADFWFNRDEATQAIFERWKPDLFFATHASTMFEERLLRSAVRSSVPVSFMVLSWDHLSSKILLSARYDRIFVWNEVTKREILETYPSYDPSQIAIVGAPQFDIYAQPPDVTYDAWCRQWGLDPSRRTLLFTTAPDVRHEQQHIVARDLLEEIVRGTRLPPDLQLFLKCHPFDENPAYRELVGRYPVAVYRPAAGLTRAQENWIPSPEELTIARDSLAFCSLNINVFSTVTLEAAQMDKPVVHLAFDPVPVSHRIPTSEYYKFDHFSRVVDMGASSLVYSHDELVEAIARYLTDPTYKSAERRRVAQTFLGDTVGRSSASVCEQLVAGARALETADLR